MLLCFACVDTLCALELVHQSDVFYSSVVPFICADRSGTAAARFLAAAAACGILLLCLAAENRKSYCSS